MSPERRPTRDEIFSGPHQNIVRALRKLPPPDIDLFRRKFESGEFEPSDACFIGIWLIHTQGSEQSIDRINLGLAYLSQAVEFNPSNSFCRWVLSREKMANEATAMQTTQETSQDQTAKDEKPTEAERFFGGRVYLDFAAIEQQLRERRRAGNEVKPTRRRWTDRRKKGIIWSLH